MCVCGINKLAFFVFLCCRTWMLFGNAFSDFKKYICELLGVRLDENRLREIKLKMCLRFIVVFGQITYEKK